MLFILFIHGGGVARMWEVMFEKIIRERSGATFLSLILFFF